MRSISVTCLALALAACGGGSDPGDVDAGGMDGGASVDAGVDAGVVMDAGDTDAGEETDASGTDAGDVDAGDVDAGDVDAGDTDAGDTDAGAMDAGDVDAGDLDAGSDAGFDGATLCEAMDVAEGTPCGPTERPLPRYVWDGRSCVFAPWCRCTGTDCGEIYRTEADCLAIYRPCLTACRGDADCPSGAEWCEEGVCVPCDNSGLLCDIACSTRGWSTYERNGCFPCECGPPPGCRSDADCGADEACFPGDFCWCPGGGRSPECCLGNICAHTSCPDPPPTGCVVRGCPRGEECTVMLGMCTPSSCSCGPGGLWGCTRDCGGGTCGTP